MKKAGCVLFMVVLLVGCARRTPEPSYLERMLMVPTDAWCPLEADGMLAPGVFAMRRQVEGGMIISVFRVFWIPDGRLVPDELLCLVEEMCFERILDPPWDAEIESRLAKAGRRLTHLVSGRLQVIGFDAQVEVDLIGLETWCEEKLVFTWIKDRGGEDRK